MDETLNLSANQTVNTTNVTLPAEDKKPSLDLKKKFNLANLIENAVYAAECSEDTSENTSQDFLNASQIQDHQTDPFNALTQPLETSDTDLDYSQSTIDLENAILNYTQSSQNNDSCKFF